MVGRVEEEGEEENETAIPAEDRKTERRDDKQNKKSETRQKHGDLTLYSTVLVNL